MSTTRATKRPLKRITSWAVIFVITLTLLELSIVFLLGHGGLLMKVYKRPYQNPFREYYERIDRKIVTYLPECARYDEDLAYTLKPGVCRFRNREFDVEYRTNSAGVRDDESSLQSPEVIVLGDSHAMGWGVDQDQTFADLIETTTGRKVLNAAIASYGTVRELKMLERLNRDNVRHLIIQYCNNDIFENREYREHGNTLPIMSSDTYDAVVRGHLETTRYYPGKHSFVMLEGLFLKFISLFASPVSAATQVDDAEGAELFLNALLNSPVSLDDLNIIVFEVNSYAANGRAFINALNALIAAREYPAFIERLVTLDFSTQLTPDKYFALDEHMKPEGYRIIGDALSALVIKDSDISSVSLPR